MFVEKPWCITCQKFVENVVVSDFPKFIAECHGDKVEVEVRSMDVAHYFEPSHVFPFVPLQKHIEKRKTKK